MAKAEPESLRRTAIAARRPGRTSIRSEQPRQHPMLSSRFGRGTAAPLGGGGPHPPLVLVLERRAQFAVLSFEFSASSFQSRSGRVVALARHGRHRPGVRPPHRNRKLPPAAARCRSPAVPRGPAGAERANGPIACVLRVVVNVSWPTPAEQRAATMALAVTGGGLVFDGDVNGRFRAFDDRNGVVPFVVELRVANSRSPLRSHLCYATSATTPSGGASASRAPTRCCRSR